MDRPDPHTGVLPVSSTEDTEATNQELSPNDTDASVLLSKVADLEARVLSLEKKYRDERQARISLDTKFESPRPNQSNGRVQRE